MCISINPFSEEYENTLSKILTLHVMMILPGLDYTDQFHVSAKQLI